MGAIQCCSSSCQEESKIELDVRGSPNNLESGDEKDGEGLAKVLQETDLKEGHHGSTSCSSFDHTEDGQKSPTGTIVRGQTEASVLSDKVPARLREGLDRVRELTCENRFFEAKTELELLEADAPRYCSDDEEALKEFQENISSDPDVVALRGVLSRLESALRLLRPQALPTGPKDSRWATVDITDPQVGKDFHAEIKMRFAETSERDPKGDRTQLVVCGKLTGYPLPLERFVSVYRETDLYRKEWIDHCERCEGQVGGAEKLYGAMSHVVNSSPMLPLKMELLTIREFVMCSQSPIADKGPGVLVMDISPPPDSTEFAGWRLPGKQRGLTRITGLELLLYFEPRPDIGGCDVFAVSKLGVPLPQWLVPLSLVKRFLAGHFMSVFKAIKLKIANEWDSLSYGQRIEGCQDFYRQIDKTCAGRPQGGELLS